VYISDKPGQHDFDLLRRLVLPDGSGEVLACRDPGLHGLAPLAQCGGPEQ
jgi:hypothetical protein